MFNKQLIAALCFTAASAATIKAITDEVDLKDNMFSFNTTSVDDQLAQAKQNEKILKCIEFDSEADFENSFNPAPVAAEGP